MTAYQQLPQGPPQRKKTITQKWWFWVALAVVVAALLFAGCSIVIGAANMTTTTTEQAAPAYAPTETTQSDTPTTTKPLSAQEQLTAEVTNAVGKALGDSNRDMPARPDLVHATRGEEVFVGWPVNESLTEGTTKDEARIETMNVLKAVRGTKAWTIGKYKAITVRGTYPLVNDYGEQSEETVFNLTFNRATVNRFVFDNLDTHKVFLHASSGKVHPAFQY